MTRRAKTFEQRWEALKRWLRTRFPLAYPVRITNKCPATEKGTMYTVADCTFDEDAKRFLIRVAPQQAFVTIQDSLIHEWSHALVWHVGDVEHGSTWAAALGMVYRALLEWNYGEPLENE